MLTHIQDFLLLLLFASQAAVMGMLLGIVYRTIATHLA
jgi:cobalamin biosynthesis protein CbiG